MAKATFSSRLFRKVCQADWFLLGLGRALADDTIFLNTLFTSCKPEPWTFLQKNP